MNTADLRSLAERAEGVEGRQSVRLREVHDRIRVTRRRRTATAIGAAAMAMVVAGAAVVFRPTADQTSPAPDPAPSPSIPTQAGEDPATPDRPLTYAVGQKIHYGDEVVDTGQAIAAVDITDAGVVYLTAQGELWFTDGSRPRLIEKGSGTYDERLEVVTAATGSRIAWMRSAGEQPREVVVYDVTTREFVFTAPAGASVWPDFDTSQPQSQTQVLTDDQVVAYYSDTFYHGRDIGQVRYVSYDLETGRRTQLTYEEFEGIAVAAPGRSLAWRGRGGDPESLIRGSTDAYRVRDGALTVDVFDDEVGVWRVADVVDPVSGRLLVFQTPAGLPAGMELRLFQWLDDHVFALVGTGPRGHDNGPIVVCAVSDQRCEVADPGPADWITPGREFYE